SVDDDKMATLVDEAGVARMHPAVRCLGRRGGFVVLVVFQEYAGRLEKDFSIVGNLDVDAGARFADRIGENLAVRLKRDEDARFGLTVKLLQVYAKRAIEAEKFGADCFASGVREA